MLGSDYAPDNPVLAAVLDRTSELARQWRYAEEDIKEQIERLADRKADRDKSRFAYEKCIAWLNVHNPEWLNLIENAEERTRFMLITKY
jgi:hypothetical protein